MFNFMQMSFAIQSKLHEIWPLVAAYRSRIALVCSRLKANMEYLQHDYILTLIAYEPLIVCLIL